MARAISRASRGNATCGPAPVTPDLGIWPEGTLGEDPRLYPEVGAPLAASIRVVDAPTLVGAIIGPPGGAQYNASLLYDGAANVTGIYEKTHLVPFGEYVPFRSLLGGIPQLRQLPTDLTPGPDVHTLAVGGITFGVAICFENSFPEIDRALVREGAGFLVTSINNSSYGHTAASSQHLQMDRFRAVENARWVVHAAVSGVSAFVSPDGRVYDATGLFEPATIRMTLRTSTARTLYTRFGDWFPWFSLLLAFGGLLLPRRRGPAPQAEPLREGARTLVILPTYDERPTIGPVLDRLLALGENVDVFVIDDGSPDGTGDIVAEVAAREPRVRLTRRPRKAGLASAYLLGFKHALEQRYDVAVEMDSDLSHVPEELPRLLAAAGSFDLVIGSRYVPGGSVSNWSRTRVLLSRAGNLYARLCLGLPLRDSTSGFRAYRRPLLEHLITGGIHAEGYGFQIELADRAWRDGYAIAEVPITFREREHGHSKISRRIVVEALWMVTRWGLRERFSPSRRARAERP